MFLLSFVIRWTYPFVVFWWKPKSDSGRYLAWKAWADLFASKIKGGLGFRGAKCFNDAFLTKLTCLVVSGRDSP